MIKNLLVFIAFLLVVSKAQGQQNISTIANNGWAKNSVNTVIFRKNSLTTFGRYQFAAYYDDEQHVVLAKRKINSQSWEVLKADYKGDATDAHKSISLMVDGKGYLHVAWGQHNNKLNYVRSVKPLSLVLGKKEQMVGRQEDKVSYPEFYQLANGNLLFFYRDGGSGNGNLMINRYDSSTRQWARVQTNLIDGEGKRNAYVQTAVDESGAIHLSWVWRETPDVASNHDLCYAKSTDGGLTWQTSTGVSYQLPITAKNAEYAFKIPEGSELINQTSMFADKNGNPFIATYWRPAGQTVPQYQMVYKVNGKWQLNTLQLRKTPFSLSGGGTKKIPISRPQLVCWQRNKTIGGAIIFRDIERGNKVSLAFTNDLAKADWKVIDLTETSVGEWEPTLDAERWKKSRVLDLFVQKVEQIDGEGKANLPPSKVQVLSWKLGDH